MQPNFFIIGAPKAGTTSLFHYLDQHPRIFMSPVKEPHYFASEIRPENLSREYRNQMVVSGIAATWQDYLALFHGATDEVAIGEASVCYLWSPTAARNIFARIPNRPDHRRCWRHPAMTAPLVTVVYNCVANGYVRRSFREQIDACVRSRETQFSPTHPFLELGMYCRQIEAYLDLFLSARTSEFISIRMALPRSLGMSSVF